MSTPEVVERRVVFGALVVAACMALAAVLVVQALTRPKTHIHQPPAGARP